MGKQLTAIWEYALQLAKEEDQLPKLLDFTEIDSEKVKVTVNLLNEKLVARDDTDKKIKDKLKYITNIYVARTKRYGCFCKVRDV